MKYFLALFLVVLVLTSLVGCKKKEDHTIKNLNNDNMISTEKKVLLVIAPKDFRDLEYFIPKKILEEGGLTTVTASIQYGLATGVEGGEVNVDMTVTEVNIDDYAAVVFVGGSGMGKILNDDTLGLLARRFYQSGKLVTAICVAPAIFARAGIVNGFRVTAWPDVKQRLVDAGAIFVEKNVVSDENFITANGPESAEEFARAILDRLIK